MTAHFKSFRAVLGWISGGIKKSSLLESLREYPKSFRRIFGQFAFGVAFGIAFGLANGWFNRRGISKVSIWVGILWGCANWVFKHRNFKIFCKTQAQKISFGERTFVCEIFAMTVRVINKKI